MPAKIVSYIEHRREQMGLTQVQFGDKIGLSRRQINGIINGKRKMTVDQLESALKFLNVNLVMVPSEGVISFGS